MTTTLNRRRGGTTLRARFQPASRRRHNAMLASSAMPALALASLFASPQPAQAANCQNDTGQPGVYVRLICDGADATQPSENGETPNLGTQTVSGNLSGTSGKVTAQFGGNGGNGSEGAGHGNGNGNGFTGGGGGNGAAIALVVQGSTVNGSDAATAVSAYGHGGAGGKGGMHGGSGGIGGTGGSGGSGGQIHFTLTHDASIVSSQVGAIGVDLQSGGGLGGSAADAEYASGSVTANNGAAGGSGGSIGDAGNPVLIQGSISSQGTGLRAQTRGGYGGQGGNASGNSGSARGGNGGAGGTAGAIAILLDHGTIKATGTTPDDTSLSAGNSDTQVNFAAVQAGIQALSAGGQGGTGGEGSAGFGKGTGGGGGSAPSDVGALQIANNGGRIETTGYLAAGMLAQSLGGHGGNGALGGGMWVSQGGNAAVGGNGGAVTLLGQSGGTSGTDAAWIITEGDYSPAMAAQSFGGGGGFGGSAKVTGVFSGVSYGGTGGLGGNGGNVTIDNSDQNQQGSLLIKTEGSHSIAMMAQSVGGGGGYGGDAYTLNFGAGGSVSIGGSAGGGGNGGKVGIVNAGSVATYGALAYAALGQSIGGGGGNGGSAYSIQAQLTPTIAVAAAIGGTGGTGGDGGAVDITNHGSLVTEGASAIGVIAQSIGGGGGNGGSAATDMIDLFPPNPELPNYAVELTTTIGGQGGSGGNGGAVSLTNQGAIITNGTSAWGMLLQSIGGGGGNGGDADAFSFALQSTSISVNTTIGGNGGNGGTGGSVTLHNSSQGVIETYGDDALGVVAQSIGGGGGNGGGASARQVNLLQSDEPALNVSVSLGGNGGAGGLGGVVTIVNDAKTSISTSGNSSRAIFAQSIGGGGGWAGGGVAVGSGGSSAAYSANIGIGGSGGSGEAAGAVNVTNSGTIYTGGASSAGIFAQSIGGGGGVGGAGAGYSGSDGNVQVADYLATRAGIGGDVIQLANNIWDFKGQVTDGKQQLDNIKKLNEAYNNLRTEGKEGDFGKAVRSQMQVSVGGGKGGKGGGGGDGDAVTIVNHGYIQTDNAYSDAIFAQSIGGGGGDGGAAHSSAGSTPINANVAVGGGGGTGGDGRTVEVDNDGTIQTSGDLSHGINAQSIGGGGGRGGATVGISGESAELVLSIGSDGGSFGSAGLVTVKAGGTIITGAPTDIGLTTGANGSVGVLAQSVGGGGGQVALFGSAFGERGQAQSSYQAEILPHAPTIKIGGKDGTGGDSDGVSVSLTGTIGTSGKDAYGVLAQSVGGGGGIVFSPIAMADQSNPEAMFGGGSLNGFGGNVSVALSASAKITTHGDGAVGILAQSIGGGGGLIGGMSNVDVTAIATTSSSVHQGSGGNVSVTFDSGYEIAALIETFGARAHGIVAQSAAGGGFFAGSDGAGFAASTESCTAIVCSNAAAINVELHGTVNVHGAGSYGIVAQNRGGLAGGTVDVHVYGDGGIVADGQAAGAVYIDNPNGTTTITNDDYLVGWQGSQVAVNGTPAVIVNNLYMSGDLLTTSGSHVVTNNAGAVMLPVSRIVASAVNNSGALVTGYAAPSSVTITGNLNNSGWLVFNMPTSGTPASLTVNGTATLSSSSFIGILGSPVLVETFTALTAGTLTIKGSFSAGAVLFDGLRFSLPDQSTFGYTVAQSGNLLTVTPRLNSSSQLGVSLTPNEAATADHLSAAFAAGNAGYARKAFEGIYRKAPTADKYKALLDEIGGHTLGAMLSSRRPLQRVFIDNMMSCPDFVGDGTATDETSCVWARFQQSWIDNDHDAGFNADAQRYQMGIQVEVDDGWFLGASGGYENETIDSRGANAHLRGDMLSLGALVKRVTSNWTLAASATGTIGNFSSHRALSISSDPATASPRTQGLALQIRAAYQIPMAGWYLRPGVSVTGHYLHLDGFTETGSDFPLQIAPAGNWSLAVAPSLEAGGRLDIGKTVLRPFVRGGVLYEHNNDWAHQASLVNARVDLGSYTSQINQPDWSATLAAGVDAHAGKRMTLRFEYSGELNGNTRAHTATLKLGYRF